MSFDGVRQALDELGAVANRDKDIAEMKNTQQQNRQLIHENNQLHAEVKQVKDENSLLKGKAKLNEDEIQRRAEALARDMWKRWLIEIKPTAVASAVKEEITGYPSNCTASTRQVIDAKVEQRLQEEMKEGWNAIFFGISNGFKAANSARARVS